MCDGERERERKAVLKGERESKIEKGSVRGRELVMESEKKHKLI